MATWKLAEYFGSNCTTILVSTVPVISV